jgi:hypothetical protein
VKSVDYVEEALPKMATHSSEETGTVELFSGIVSSKVMNAVEDIKEKEPVKPAEQLKECETHDENELKKTETEEDFFSAEAYILSDANVLIIVDEET